MAVDYTLIRTNRKTIALRIRNGGLEVRAPRKMPLRYIEGIITSHEQWIMDKLAKSHALLNLREGFILNYGSTITLRGEEYAITARNGRRAGFDGAVFYLPPDLSPERIKSVCIRIYRGLAKVHLPSRVSLYSRLMGVSPLSVKISGAKKRWGSCSGKGNVNFSWRLMMAETELIDYVVVHELAHLTEMNHSARFWTIVEQVIPDCRQRRKRLRELQDKINQENWD